MCAGGGSPRHYAGRALNLLLRRLKCHVCSARHRLLAAPSYSLRATHSKHRHHVLSCKHVLPARGCRQCAASVPRALSVAHARRVEAAMASLALQTLRRHGRAPPATSAHEEINARAMMRRKRAATRARARAGQWPPVYSKLKTRECAAVGRPSGRGAVTAAAVLSPYIAHFSLIFRPPPSPGPLTFAPRSRAGAGRSDASAQPVQKKKKSKGFSQKKKKVKSFSLAYDKLGNSTRCTVS